MKKKLYDIKDFEDYKSIVYETRRQKDILDILDEMIENASDFGWSYIFEDSSFYIEYADGSTYEAHECGEYGTYKKKGIARIIYVNANDTQVFGKYEVNEYGNVT
ncbi:MAG: hypothetical protein ACLRZ9_05700 [Eubacterium sp.]